MNDVVSCLSIRDFSARWLFLFVSCFFGLPNAASMWAQVETDQAAVDTVQEVAGAPDDTTGQASDKPANQNPNSEIEVKTPAIPPVNQSRTLPESTKEFRQVFFFQSQVAELVPPTFRPIDLSELDQKLKGRASNEIDGSATSVEEPQLIRSVYIARLDKDRLNSSLSYWDIAYRGNGQARLEVGRLGLALKVSPGEVSGDANDQVVSDLSGNSSVVVNKDTRISFGWSSAGRVIERGLMFDIAIPPSIQTRFLIEAPREMELQAVDGVGRSLPSPPPEAGVPTVSNPTTTATSWYSIEAGGLSRVRLRLINRQRGESESVLPVRQASIQYELLPQSIRFVTRMLVDARPGSMLPVLSIDHGHVTSVRIGGTAIPWTEVTTANGTGIRIDDSRLDAISTSGTINLTVEGETAWSPGGGTQSLPWPRWRDCRPILVATEMQAQVRLDASLNVLRFQLPNRWYFAPAASGEDNSRLIRCVGVLGQEGPAVLVRSDEKQSPAESILRLSATSSKFVAQFDTSIVMNKVGPQPVQLRLDRGWTADLVTIPISGRVIDFQTDPSSRQNIVIWPSSDELKDNRLHVRVVGSMPMRSVAGRIEFPATSFATIQNSRNRVAALVTAPTGFNWTGDVALRTTRITADSLTPVQRTMLGDVPSDGLLLELNEGRLAPLVSRRPDVNLDTTSRLSLRREGERLIETLLIACDSNSTDIQDIVVDLGNPLDRPPMQWSAVRMDGSNRRIDSATRIKPDDVVMRESPGQLTLDPNVSLNAESDDTNDARQSPSLETNPDQPTTELWRIQLGSLAERLVMLVGRREYAYRPGRQLPLPSVPGASNQASQVIVMPSLTIKQTTGSVLRIPPVSMAKGALQQFTSVPVESEPVPGAMLLRYEATENPTIELDPVQGVSNGPIVWQESVRIMASNRGGDLIVAKYSIEPGTPLGLIHDVNLRVVSVSDSKGVAIPFEGIANELQINCPPTTSEIVVTWSRPVFSHSIGRRWVAPQIHSNALTLRRDWQLVAAVDTLIPAASVLGFQAGKRKTGGETSASDLPVSAYAPVEIEVFKGTVEGPHLGSMGFENSTLSITPEIGAVWILDSALAFPVASIIGLILFAINWSIALRNPFLAFIAWIFSAVPAIFLQTSGLLWISAACVPLAAGGLIALTMRMSRSQSRVLRPGTQKPTLIPLPTERREASLGSSLSRITPHRESASSWSTRMPVWLLIIFATSYCGKSSYAFAQNETRASTSPAAIAGAASVTAQNASSTRPLLLVPTNERGEISGSKVYIPQDFYFDLFRASMPEAKAIQVKSASYRLRLEGSVETETTGELEARFQLEDTSQRTDARLPFRAGQIKSVQWLTDLDSRPLRWSADGDSAIRLTLPSALNASLFIRLNIEVQATSPFARRIRFAVPPIAGASLLVDAGTSLQRMDIAKSLGEIELQPELGRLSTSLGAVDEIDVSLTYRDSLRSSVSIAKRRYWIHARYDRTNIECEIDLSDPMTRKGSDVLLTMLDGQTPIVTSTDWAMVAVETISSARQQLTVQSQRDNPGPIRLLWEVDSIVPTSVSNAEPVLLSIPEIQSNGSQVTLPPTSIALEAAQGLTLVAQVAQLPANGSTATGSLNQSEENAAASLAADVAAAANRVANALTASSSLLQSSTTNPELIDAFVSSWKGYRGSATEVITASSPLPRLLLTTPTPVPWTSEEVHHLHVRPGELQLSYTATISPGDRLVGPLRVVLPVGSELRVLTMNGVSVDTVPRRVGNRDEVALPELPNKEAVRLRVVLHMRVSQTGRFNPPKISVEPIEMVKGTYSLSRDQALMVSEIVNGGLIEADNPPMGTQEQLIGGWIPCWTWRIDQVQSSLTEDSNRRPQLPGVFRVESRDVSIECQQRNSLIWSQTRWSFETLLRLHAISDEDDDLQRGRAPIDFVNIELPTSWCDNLTIEPDMAWSRQPAMDAATQIVRIRPGAAVQANQPLTIRIRGERRADAESRIEVPSVRVLGTSKREVYLSVPGRLEGRPLDWEASAAIAAQMPEELIGNADSRDRRPERVTRGSRSREELTFRAVAGNASVHLAPSRYEATEPRAMIADVQWFSAQRHRSVIFCRWDLSPGRDEFISVRLPAKASLNGVWIDDQPMHWKMNGDKVVVQLPLSRLAQSVVFVCDVEHNVGDPQALIPILENVPVDETWLTIYESNDISAAKASITLPADWTHATERARILSLATSIRNATESSLRRVTERSQDQIVHWIQSWNKRFEELGTKVAKIEETHDRPDSLESDPTGVNLPWEEQNRRWRQYVRRVAGDVESATKSLDLRWMPSEHWRVVAVAKSVGNFASSPKVRTAERSSTLIATIQTMLVVAIACGLCTLLWHTRRWAMPLATHPATWLFMTGISSLAVAPIPVAIAICIVALTAPVLNRPSSPRQVRS